MAKRRVPEQQSLFGEEPDDDPQPVKRPRREPRPLVDPPAARAARERGINVADAHATEAWKDLAYGVVCELARTRVPFTADHVVEVLERDHPDVITGNLAALGPVFLRASRDGAIHKTGVLRASTIPRRHRDLTEWVGS